MKLVASAMLAPETALLAGLSGLVLAALFFALHLRSTPPAISTAGMHAAMEHELERWNRLLS